MEHIIGYFEEIQPDFHDFYKEIYKEINKLHTSTDVKQRISSLKFVFNWNTEQLNNTVNNTVQFETEWIQNTNH